LLDVAVIIFRVLVEHQPAKLLHGKLRARPDLSDIKWIETKLVWIGILRFHNLNHSSIFDLFATFDGLPKIALRVIWIFTTHLCGFLLSELLLAVLRNEVIFDVHELAFGVYPFEGMAPVSVETAPSLRGAMITEEHEAGMVALRRISQEVEYPVIIKKKVLGIAVLGSNDIWSLDGIAAEEHRLVKLACSRAL
jgi:hypothetical protein